MKNRAGLIPKVGALTLVALHDQDAHRKADAISYLRATFTHEELLQVAYNMYVNHRASVVALNSEINALDDEADQLVRERDALVNWVEAAQNVAVKGIPAAFEAGLSIPKAKASIRAKKGADALHNKAGGSREKQKAIRELWASGKFASRGLCAEQECAGLNMSLDAARKALRNTPKPA